MNMFFSSYSSRVSVLEAFDPLLMGNANDSEDDHDERCKYNFETFTYWIKVGITDQFIVLNFECPTTLQI